MVIAIFRQNPFLEACHRCLGPLAWMRLSASALRPLAEPTGFLRPFSLEGARGASHATCAKFGAFWTFTCWKKNWRWFKTDRFGGTSSSDTVIFDESETGFYSRSIVIYLLNLATIPQIPLKFSFRCFLASAQRLWCCFVHRPTSSVRIQRWLTDRRGGICRK